MGAGCRNSYIAFSNQISPLVALNNILTILAKNQTRVNTDSATFATLHTYTLTNAQADYDFIKVEFVGAANTSSTNKGVIGVFNGNTQISGDSTIVNETTVNFSIGVSGLIPISGFVILVAGTDYTKGTGFTINIKGIGNGGSAGNGTQCFKSIVSAYNV